MNQRQQIAEILNEAKSKIYEKTGIVVNVTVVYSRAESQKGAEQLLKDMCAIWGVTPEWLRVPSRKEDRPMMRRVFWMAAKQRFPQVSYAVITVLAGVGNHTTAVKGIEEARRWLEIKDPLLIRYYEPVIEFMGVDPVFI